MSLTWYSVNNTAEVSDLPDLAALGITMLCRSTRPMHVWRDPDTGRMVAEVGMITVWRDGRIRVRLFADAPEMAGTMLVRTALDCAERDLHKRDRWAYTRATKRNPGYWNANILCTVPEGESLFEAHAAMMRPAALDRRERLERALSDMESRA